MKSLAKNYFWNLLYQVLIVLLPLITAPYLSRVLGADRIGEFSFAQSLVSYFVLFSVLGTTLYGQRRIAACYAKGESKKQAFIELILLRGICTLISLGIYFSMIYSKADNQLLYLIAAIEILAVVFDISWFFQGIEQFGHIALCNAFSKVLGVAAIFLFVKTRDDLEQYVLFYCGSLLLGNVFQWFFLPRYLKDESLHKPLVIPHLKPTLRLFVSQFAIQAYTVLDKTMIGLITQLNFENGYYDQAQKLIKALSAIVNSIGAVMASRIAIVWNADKEERDSQIQELLLFSFRLVFAISLPLAACTIVIASRFVPIFFGDGYDAVVCLIQALAIIIPIIGCSNVIGIQLFVPSGREYLLTRSVAVGALVNVVLNSFFISRWAALGAVIASVFAEIAVTGVQLFYVRKEIPLKMVLRLFVRYLTFAIAVAAVASCVALFVGTGLWGMVIIVAICIILYGGFLLMIHDPVLELFSM